MKDNTIFFLLFFSFFSQRKKKKSHYRQHKYFKNLLTLGKGWKAGSDGN